MPRAVQLMVDNGATGYQAAVAARMHVEMGEPVKASLDVRQSGANFEFTKVLRSRLGGYIDLIRSGRSARDLWKMEAKNEEGTFAKLYPLPDQ